MTRILMLKAMVIMMQKMMPIRRWTRMMLSVFLAENLVKVVDMLVVTYMTIRSADSTFRLFECSNCLFKLVQGCSIGDN